MLSKFGSDRAPTTGFIGRKPEEDGVKKLLGGAGRRGLGATISRRRKDPRRPGAM